MGLRLFKTPVEPEVAAKPKESVASPARTSIRRQRTVRGPHARLLADHRRRRALQMFDNNANVEDTEAAWEVTRYPPGSPPEIDEPMRGYADFELSRSNGRPPVAEGAAALSRLGDVRRDRANLAARENRMRILNRQNLVGEPDGPLPPVPESRDFASRLNDNEREENARLSSIRREVGMTRRQHSGDGETGEESRARLLSALTNRRMLPWYRASTGNDAEGDSEVHTRLNEENQWILDHPFTLPSVRDGPTRIRSGGSVSIEEIRARRAAAQARLDGLGDRDRSLSPLYPEGEATWDTLQTSITPDPQPPSVGSSFASSSAAAAASSSSLPQSLNTSMTTDEDPTNNDCDGPESDSEWDGEDADMDELIPQRLRAEYSRTYANVARADRIVRLRLASGRDTDLGDMQRIISRLAEQNEIPDEWWAGAGLSRNVRREP